VSLQRPEALWLLALLPLIVLLYILRSQRTQAYVTTMRFWRRLSSDLEGKPARRLPWREPLMWLQLLVVALLALALAGPFVPGGERTHLVIVLDRSASMLAQSSGETMLAAAKALAIERIDQMGADDSVSLITVGQTPEVVGTWPADSRSSAAKAVAGVSPVLGQVDPLGALALASEVARRTRDAKPSIVIYTDSAMGRIDAARVGTVMADVTVQVVGAPVDDVAVRSVKLRQSPTGRGRSTALVTLGNASSIDRNVSLRVTADGIGLGARPVTIPGSGSATAAFTLPLGTQVVEAAIDGADDYALDDKAYAMLSVPRQGEIRVVTANPMFWERALGGIPGFKLTTLRSAMYRPAPAALHVFDGFVPSDAMLPRTPVLLVNPPAPRSSDQNAQGARGSTAPPVSVITRVDPASPLLRSVDLIGVSVSSAGLGTTPPWAEVVASTRSGPVLLSGINAGARTVVMAFDPTRAGFDRDVAFPILVANAFAWLVGDQTPAELEVGGTRVYSPSPAAREVFLRLPSGRAIAYPARGAPIALSEFTEPGVYTIVERDQAAAIRTETIVVNLPESERLSEPSGGEVLAGLRVAPPMGTTGAASLLWLLAAAAALVIALAEWVLYSMGWR